MTKATVFTGVAVCVLVIGCGDETRMGSGGGGAMGTTSSTTTTSSTSATTSSTTTSTSTSTSTSSTTVDAGPECTAPCCLGSTCKVVDKECVGLVDNAGKTTFGLRMSELKITAPPALSIGVLSGIIAGAVTPANPGCNLSGAGAFSWLLQFDLATETLRTGGAKPVADEVDGYSFVNEVIDGRLVAPVAYDVTMNANGGFTTEKGEDIVLPVYIDSMASTQMLFPLRQARFVKGALSSSQNCIGHYNSEGLDVNNACLPDGANASFVTGASVTGMITLEDADTIMVSSHLSTLCVLLAGNSGVAGPNGYKVCERDAGGSIVFQGDACSLGTECKDAVSFAADFAASSVKIN